MAWTQWPLLGGRLGDDVLHLIKGRGELNSEISLVVKGEPDVFLTVVTNRDRAGERVRNMEASGGQVVSDRPKNASFGCVGDELKVPLMPFKGSHGSPRVSAGCINAAGTSVGRGSHGLGRAYAQRRPCRQ